ncbi:glycine cleavage system protein GcvH [Minwuia sp.]|uniref:glycine cleavage system protein GcvH n=1 Tax=Minwuia sp. TaxID=2493630 RepID=UPI003A91C17A
MADIRFTKDHEWIVLDGDEATVGISEYAQDQLGDVVYVELPDPGTKLTRGKEAAVVESVKAASEVYAPVDGEVTARNDDLDANPALVNEDAEGGGWFYRMKVDNKDDLAGLMDREAYEHFVEALD